MDDWEKFNEISLPGKEDFYSNLNMEGIIDTDYTQTKGVCKDFEKKIRRISWFIGWKQHITVSRCAWELWKIESWNIWAWSCKIYFSSWISMTNSFKKYWSNIRSFNWYQYAINGRRKILEEEYVLFFIHMQKLTANTWKIMMKIENSHILNIGI